MLRMQSIVWGLALGLLGCMPPPRTQPAPAPAAKAAPAPAAMVFRAPARGPEPVTGPPKFEVSAAALSADGKLALTGFQQVGHGKPRNAPEGKLVMLWDMVAGKRQRTFVGHEGGIKLVAFLPGGTHMLSAGGASIRVWELKTGKHVWTAQLSSGQIEKAVLSTDGKRLLYWGGPVGATTAAGDSLYLWDIPNAKLIRRITGFKRNQIRNMVLSPDGRLAFISTPGTDIYLSLLDLTIGKIVQTFKWKDAWRYPYAFTPDGKWALSQQTEVEIGARGHMVLWDVATGKVIHRFAQRHPEDDSYVTFPKTAAFTPNGKRVLTADDDGLLRTWNVASGREVSAVHVPGYPAGVFSADARRMLKVSGLQDESSSIHLTLWDTTHGKRLRNFDANTERWRYRNTWTEGELAGYP